MSALTLLVLLVGCKEDDIKLGDTTTGGGDSGGNNNNNTSCETVVVSNVPADGATEVAVTTEISFTLSEADSTAQITTDISGTQSFSEDGLSVIWTPDAALDSETSYTVSLDFCGGESSFSFTTAASFAGNVEDKTYALELSKATIDEPPGVGGLLGDYLPSYVLVGVMAADATSLSMMGALAEEGTEPPQQDMCQESLDFPTAAFRGQPYFQIGPADTLFAVAGYSVTLYGMELSGTFSEDGSSIEDGTLKGAIDTRDIGDAVGYSADEICSLVGLFGASCDACPSDGDAYCLTLSVSDLRGGVVDGLQLVVVTDPQCAN